MDTLPPIPTPVAQRWREIRIRVMPIAFFACVAVVVAFLWRDVAIPPTFAVGFVETNAAIVSAPMDGMIAQLVAKRFSQVKGGDQLCQFIIKDPRIVQAELAVIKADITKIETTMGPVVDEERARLAYYQLRVDLMKERGVQAMETIQLKQAIEEFRGAENLLRDGTISTNAYEQAKTRRDSLQASVDERRRLIDGLTGDLSRFSLSEIGTSGKPSPIQAAINVEDAKIKALEATSQPIQLVAPIDGMITSISRHSGEYVRTGDPILAISATQSEQIVGYVRQPMSVQPRVGMPVQVRVRSPQRETATATVAQIGAQMEPFSMAMIPNAPNQRLTEFGLPILVTLPPTLKLVPGQLVDLILDSK